MSPLPIDEVIPALRATLDDGRALVLQAPPGAGKTTRVPLALLNQPWLGNRAILLLEPRRLAARAAAARLAELLGEPLGQRVGYRIRFDTLVSAQTRIEVITEGILTRRLQNDPTLDGVGMVIFDEFHERSLHADLALALCLDSQRGLRPDLRLLVMSATLDGEAVARLLGAAPLITSRGRQHPVTVHYLARDPTGPVAVVAAQGTLRALREQAGDILVFLPGGGEIRQAETLLRNDPATAGVAVLPLYGDLAAGEQQRALRPDPSGQRKIVLATPIAETSLTIEGISTVVDAGWARVPRFEPRSGLTRLETVRVSADSAEQRAGRAGRLGPGVCYRLWSEATQRALQPRRAAEIVEADLAPLALELALWGVRDTADLSWLDPPPAGALAQARALLAELEALDEAGRITPTGRALADLPMHPRLAHMLRRADALGLGGLACDLAALLEERDLPHGDHRLGCDITLRLDALRAFRRKGRSDAGFDPAARARADQAARQWRSRLGLGRYTDSARLDAASVGLLLAFAYPDRVAKLRDGEKGRYLLANGRGARLAEHDPLLGTPALVAAQLDAGASEGCIYLAAPFDLAELEKHFAGRIAEREVVVWNPQQAAILARQERRLGNLLLSGRALASPDAGQLRRAMLEGIRQLGLSCLPWTPEIRDWQARVLSLRTWFPAEAWPDVSDEGLAATLEDWLEPHLDGIRRREHLASLELGRILAGLLPWPLPPRLETAAPTHIRVPSGSRVRLRYQPGESPVLAVKLQELFGLADTPRVAEGRVPVTLHLLSPAQRPIQVTRDLRGFWERTYAEVRKELKGRYPKHPWPDDPWNAPPTRGVRRSP